MVVADMTKTAELDQTYHQEIREGRQAMYYPEQSRAEITAGESVFYRFWKRLFDFISSLFVSILLAVPVALVAVVIMLMDPGNPFYIQKRVGQNGKEIKILKFRSMKLGADCLEKFLTPGQIVEYKKEYKLRDDPRLIGYKKPGDGDKCFGAFLRRSNIDELPQIMWNICFMGDMSVVGPRPILSEELKKYYINEEERRLFLSVKPGLTGYWQAYARNEATYESGKRQKMELYYIKNRSFWLDIKIIIKTFTRFTGKGAY